MNDAELAIGQAKRFTDLEAQPAQPADGCLILSINDVAQHVEHRQPVGEHATGLDHEGAAARGDQWRARQPGEARRTDEAERRHAGHANNLRVVSVSPRLAGGGNALKQAVEWIDAQRQHFRPVLGPPQRSQLAGVVFRGAKHRDHQSRSAMKAYFQLARVRFCGLPVVRSMMAKAVVMPVWMPTVLAVVVIGMGM